MLDKIFNVLFICFENSARSILAEGSLNSLTEPSHDGAFGRGARSVGRRRQRHGQAANFSRRPPPKRRIELPLALPFTKLERMAIQQEIQQIGTL